MLQKLTELPPGVEGVKAIGSVTKEDFERVLEPLLRRAHRENRKLRFIYELGTDIESQSAAAAWEDARVAMRLLRVFDGCAILSDLAWIKEATRLIGFAMPCPMRVFPTHARDQAIAWLRSLPACDSKLVTAS